MFKIYKKLKYIKCNLKEWNKEIFGNINQEKNNIEYKMRKLQEICIVEGYTEDRKKEEIQMTQEWEARCQQEETLWRQKSRIRWLREGERNTKFFHRTTIARRAGKSLPWDSPGTQQRQNEGHPKGNPTHPSSSHRGTK
jgi:hypothetical protein